MALADIAGGPPPGSWLTETEMKMFPNEPGGRRLDENSETDKELS